MKPLAKGGIITTLVGASLGLFGIIIYWILFVTLMSREATQTTSSTWILFLFLGILTVISLILVILSSYVLAKKYQENNLKIAIGVIGCISFWNIIVLVGAILTLCGLNKKTDLEEPDINKPNHKSEPLNW